MLEVLGTSLSPVFSLCFYKGLSCNISCNCECPFERKGSCYSAVVVFFMRSFLFFPPPTLFDVFFVDWDMPFKYQVILSQLNSVCVFVGVGRAGGWCYPASGLTGSCESFGSYMEWAVPFWVCEILTHKPMTMHVSAHQESPILCRAISLHFSDEIISISSITSHVVEGLDLRKLIRLVPQKPWISHSKFVKSSSPLPVSDLTADRYTNPKTFQPKRSHPHFMY